MDIRESNLDLHEYAKTFASQGGVEIGSWLEGYASEVPAGSAIVELGSWLGAGTAHLALGAQKSGAEIYVYDRFLCANDEERTKAVRCGVQLFIGEDTLPRVSGALEAFPVVIHYIKGSFKPGAKSARWDDKPIGLYVDDLTKAEWLWSYAMEVFGAHFIPEKTILVLMDYHFDEAAGPTYAAQKRYMARHKDEFEFLGDRMGGTSVAVFRFLGWKQ